jgi:osmoprotectant transport system ATP-binding protein
MAEAGRLADDIVLLDHGRVVQQGGLQDLLLKPASDQVRTFLGRRAQWLALEVLRLNQVIGDLPATSATADAIRLDGTLPLGQALVKLADVGDTATAAIDGKAYAVKSLRARILTDLEVAAAT